MIAKPAVQNIAIVGVIFLGFVLSPFIVPHVGWEVYVDLALGYVCVAGAAIYAAFPSKESQPHH